MSRVCSHDIYLTQLLDAQRELRPFSPFTLGVNENSSLFLIITRTLIAAQFEDKNLKCLGSKWCRIWFWVRDKTRARVFRSGADGNEAGLQNVSAPNMNASHLQAPNLHRWCGAIDAWTKREAPGLRLPGQKRKLGCNCDCDCRLLGSKCPSGIQLQIADPADTRLSCTSFLRWLCQSMGFRYVVLSCQRKSSWKWIFVQNVLRNPT